ncbi:MAG TPA: SPW repeat protein [Candidatus Udaeobacter sp.]|jgi:hypothetical protein|nr:SPW repeat protein [Candidatus Udaeobacter sp.]
MDERTMTPSKGAGWVSIVLGIWVIISPFLLSFNEISAAMWNNVATGTVVSVIGIIRASPPQRREWSWTNVVLGIWLIISPFGLGFFDQVALWNNVLVGITIVLVGWANAMANTYAGNSR